jgi:hypothetical protein
MQSFFCKQVLKILVFEAFMELALAREELDTFWLVTDCEYMSAVYVGTAVASTVSKRIAKRGALNGDGVHTCFK